MDLGAQDTTAPRIQAYIAHPASVAVDTSSRADGLQAAFAGAYELVLDASGGRKGLRIHTGGSGCSTAHVDIVEIILKPESDTQEKALADIRSQVRDVPMTLWTGVAYGVSYPGDESGRGGSGSMYQGLPATPAQDAGLEGGAAAVVSDTAGARVLAHEIFHALGAVNDNSLSSNGRGHITGDSWGDDLMGAGEILDVGHDDYFNPDGGIAGRDGTGVWNTYDSFYLCPAARCFEVPERPAVTLRGAPRDTTVARFSASGAAYYRWYINADTDPRPKLDASAPTFDWYFNSTVGVRGFSADGAVSELHTATVNPPSSPPAVGPDSGSSSGGTSGPPVAGPSPPLTSAQPPIGSALSVPPFASKLEVERARVLRSNRALDVLAPITARASGALDVEFRAAGRTERFEAEIDPQNRRARFQVKIPAAQARLGTGILTLTYGGDPDIQPQEVRLRAASQKANLDASRPRIEGGRVKATGEISSRARGVVRLQLLYEPPGQATHTLQFTAKIHDGKYRFDEKLSQAQQQQLADRRGAVHSYTLFTGYFERRIRGEMQSYQVLGQP